MKKNKGFSLIELMVVVAIVGMFSATARPYFKNYQVNANRSDTQSELVRLSQQMHFFYAVNSTFTGANPLGTTNSMQYPAKNPQYTLSLTVANNATTGLNGVSFVLMATPIRGKLMSGDGVICINQLNQKFWSAGATSCALNANSRWYGES